MVVPTLITAKDMPIEEDLPETDTGENEEKKKMRFDDFLFLHLGEIGKYQKIQFLLVCLPTIFCAMHALSWTFASVDIPHRCGMEGDAKYGAYWKDVSSKINFTEKCYDNIESLINPTTIGARCLYQQCRLKDGRECSFIVYDNSRVSQSAIGRWDIVCDRGWIKAFIQSAYYVGQLAGSISLGVLGDRNGFFPSGNLHDRQCDRDGDGGTEVPETRIRLHWTILRFGTVHPRAVAMGVRDYQLLHVIITAPALIFLSYWWLVPESARWLVSVRRYDEADKVLQKAAKTNDVTLPTEWWTRLEGEEDIKDEEQQTPGQQRRYGILDLLKTSELRQRSLVVFFLWPVVTMVYYGLTMKSDILGGDLYANFIIGGLIEMPAVFMVFLLIDRIGRRYFLATGYGLAGICLLSNLLISSSTSRWISLVQHFVARGSITATHASMYMYSPELFPTVVRNTAMGFCSAIARVGAIAASWISMWIVDRFGKEFMLVPFGTVSILAAILILVFLPETMGKRLPSTIEEVEASQAMVELKLETETKSGKLQTSNNTKSRSN